LEGLDKPWVMVLIGPPLSGKTTFIKNVLTEQEFTHVSYDNMIMELDPIQDGDYERAWKQTNWKMVNKACKSLMRKCNENRENAVIDYTNMNSKRRQSNLSFFDKEYYKIAVKFPILEMEEYRERNRIRMRTESKIISDDTIEFFLKQYNPINPKMEKFDKVIEL